MILFYRLLFISICFGGFIMSSSKYEYLYLEKTKVTNI